jgi:hypothetical protein
MILLKDMEKNMVEDGESAFKFQLECQKFGIFPIERDDDGEESPFFGGKVSWM